MDTEKFRYWCFDNELNYQIWHIFLCLETGEEQTIDLSLHKDIAYAHDVSWKCTLLAEGLSSLQVLQKMLKTMRGLRDDLWIGLVLFVDGQKPTKYLFPSTVWNEPNQMFTDSAVKNPEYGINLNQYTMKEFVEKYGFEVMVNKI